MGRKQPHFMSQPVISFALHDDSIQVCHSCTKTPATSSLNMGAVKAWWLQHWGAAI